MKSIAFRFSIFGIHENITEWELIVNLMVMIKKYSYIFVRIYYFNYNDESENIEHSKIDHCFFAINIA